MAFNSDFKDGRARSIEHTMQMEAAAEGKPNHVRHVQHQIDYADAMAEHNFKRMQEWVRQEVPKLVRQEIQKQTVQVELDEKSVNEVKRKVSDLLK